MGPPANTSVDILGRVICPPIVPPDESLLLDSRTNRTSHFSILQCKDERPPRSVFSSRSLSKKVTEVRVSELTNTSIRSDTKVNSTIQNGLELNAFDGTQTSWLEAFLRVLGGNTSDEKQRICWGFQIPLSDRRNIILFPVRASI